MERKTRRLNKPLPAMIGVIAIIVVGSLVYVVLSFASTQSPSSASDGVVIGNIHSNLIGVKKPVADVIESEKENQSSSLTKASKEPIGTAFRVSAWEDIVSCYDFQSNLL